MNKIYRIIWSTVNNAWVVTSELAKGKQKSASSASPVGTLKLSLPKFSALSILLAACGLFAVPNAFAASCSVGTAAQLGTALSNASCDTIVLTQDMTLTRNLTAALGSRTDLVIDGNGHTLNFRSYRIDFSGGQNTTNGGNVSFTNFNTISSNNGTQNAIVTVNDRTSHINVEFDNITTMPNGMIALLSNSYSASTNVQNPYSQLIIGNITNPINITTQAYKQLANASKITFNGTMSLNAARSTTAYSYIFWSNSPISQNVVTFNSGADVTMKLGSGNKFTSGDTNASKGFSYVFNDGAKFLLWSQQNVFGDSTGSNVGLKIGSYDKDTQTFGSGVTLQIAGVDGAQLTGNGLTNLGGVAGGIDNGASGSDDVIFNLAQGSNFNVTGTGIVVTKNSGNSSGIYVRSATDMNAAMGMQITHNGDGEVVVANNASITSTVAGMQMSSTSGNTMEVDLTGGSLNVTSGNGIIAGSSTTDGNVNLNIDNGTINLTGDGNGIDFSNSSAANSHVVNGTTINFASGATGSVIHNSDAKVTLKDTHINVVDTTAFTNEKLNNITFANGDNNTNNIITVTGSGTGLSLDTDLSAIKDSYLTVNVTDSSGEAGTVGTGTGVKVNGGSTSDVITVTDNVNINATGATALEIDSTVARQLVNNGIITGNVVFNNGDVNNVITNNNQLNGNITTGAGNDTLNLGVGSKTTGTINLGNGNNTVSIGDKTYVSNVVTGSGDDVFNLTNLNANSSNYIGTLDAGTGNNTLNFSQSSLLVDATTFFKNFNNINLDSSKLALVNKTNLSSGNVNINNTSSFVFSGSYNDDVGVILSGAGSVEFENGADVTLVNANNNFTGLWNIDQGATLNTSATNQLGSGSVDLAGTLNLNQTSFANALTGSGLLNINANGSAFNFTSATGTGFTGTANLSNSQLALSGNNTAALTQATLQISENGTTTVGSGNQTVGNLALNGGTLSYTTDSGVINTGTLSVKENSTVSVDVNDMISGNLLDQDTTNSQTLVNSNNSLSAADLAKIALQDSDGNALSSNTLSNIVQGGATVAIGHYGYSLLSNSGLSIAAILTQLDLQSGQTLNLNTSGSTTRDMIAQITGSGNLSLTSDATGITLNNGNNNYTGATTITAGTAIAGSNNAFGKTSQLAINTNATVNLNGKTQTVGSLANQGSLNLASGSLTLTNGGSSSATNGLSGAGTLTVSGGDLAISGANAGLTANSVINSGASITLSGAGTLGSGGVSVAGDLNLNGNNSSVANALSGAGSVNTNANVTLTGNNSSFTGTQAIGENANLTVGSNQNIGGAAATVDFAGSSSTLTLSGMKTAFANDLIGNAGVVNIANGSSTSFLGNNANFNGNYTITGGSTLSINQTTQMSNSSGINVSSSTDTLNINGTSDYTFNHALTGSGLVNVDVQGNTFNFGSNTGSAFTGQVDLSNAQFTLADNNATALNQADLTLSSGAKVTVGDGNHTLNSLTMNNGNLYFTNITESNGQFTSEGTIEADTLDVSGLGKVYVDLPLDITPNLDGYTVLQLDEGDIIVDLIKANNVIGDPTNIDLLDSTGVALPSDVAQNLINKNTGTTSAVGYFNYNITTGHNNDGLYVDYGLNRVDLQGTDSNALILESTEERNNTASGSLVALAEGTGDLAIEGQTANTIVTISNGNNTYTGKTLVRQGILKVGENGALGNTASLTISNGAKADLNGKTQTVGSLANSGTLDLANGQLTLTNGGSSTATGGLTGAGSLTINGGELTVSAANAGLTAATTIATNGAVTLTGAGTLGSSAIAVAGDLNLNGANSQFANVLSGAGNVNTNAAITLTGNNSGFTGTQVIGANGELTVGSANSLGGENASVNLINSGASLVFNAVNQAITQAISGVAGSTVNVSNGATMSLTADNSAFAGSYALSGNSSLSVSKGNNLGTSAVAIASGSNLIYNALNDGSSTALANSLSGDGSVTLSDSQMTLLAGNSNAADFTGLFDITNGSSLTLSDDAQLNDGATVNVAQTGDSLNIASSADYTMNYALTGNGLVNVDATNNGFNFSSNTGSAFAGTVNLANATFTLAGNNTSALTNATLSLSGGSKTTVSAGEQDIGNLTLNGGTLVFNADGVINTNVLNTTANTIIQIDKDNLFPSDIDTSANLLDQNSGIMTTLIEAQNSKQLSINKLTLQDLEGNALTDDVEHNLVQNGSTVAKGLYSYQLLNDSGLDLSYLLTQVDIQNAQTLTLSSSGAENREFTAGIIGSGNLAIVTDQTGITLTNDQNSYTGETTLTSGLVTLGSDNAFGNTSKLTINSGAKANLNANSQTVGSLANSGTLDLANGQLTLTNGGSSTATGGLTGAGSLTINGGELTVSAANAGLTAATTIATNGAVTLTGAGTLGSSAIAVAGDLNLNGANSQFANVLSGAGNVNTNAAITLTGNNSGFTGTQVIGANGELTVGSANSLGGENASVNLINSGASLVFNAVNQAITQAISGVAGSTVNVSNGATMSLTADNSAFAGSYALSGNSSLSVSKGNNLGTSAVAIASGSNLIYNALNDGSSTALANSLSGDGSVTLSGSQMTLLAGNSNAADFTGLFDITNGSSLTLSDDAQLNDGATVNVAQTGDSLNIASSADYTMNYALTGNGLVNVDATNNGFNFSSNTGSAFAGTVNLANATFTLAGDNTSALTNATLSLSGGSKTTVSAGEQDIGNLTLNGGTLVFNGDGVVNTNTLATAGNSIIQINQNNIPVSDTGSAINLLDQSKGQESQLVNAQDSSGLDVNKLTLQDLEGNALSDGSEHDLVQNSDTVAKAVYDYQLVNNEGLSVAYVLQQLNLLTDKTLTLDSTGATNRELTAKVTGEGNLTLTTDATGISLNNSANSYTGDTTVTAGKVTAGSNNAFGQTASLIINASAEVNLNGKTQTAGSLANSGTLDLANGQLTLTNGGSSTATGGLTGAGSLTINGGELTVSAANAGLTAATTIATNGAVTLTGAGTLGSSAIAVAGDLNLNGANSQFANVLSGAGNVNTNAAITLTGNNSGFTGTQVIGANGELTVGSANSLGGENASVNLINSGASLVFNAVNQAITQAISGVAGSTVNVSNGATMSLTADNSAFAGSYALSGNSSLSVSKGNNLGTSAVAIASGSNLIYNALNDGSSTALANSLSGDGSVTLSDSQMTLLAGNSNAADFTGLFDITNGSSLTLSDDAQLNDGATVNVAQTGDSLNIASSADYTMNYALTGNGLVNVDATNNGFNFSSNTGSAFAGTVNLANATFTLAGDNTSALTNATLSLSGGSKTTVSAGEQDIGNLTLNGGTLVFNGDGVVNTNTLATAGNSIIQINQNNIPVSDTGSAINLLDQSKGQESQLVNAQDSSGLDVNKLTLQDLEGNALSDGSEHDLVQNSDTVAKAVYDYQLVNNEGLSVAYVLQQLNLLTDKTLTLDSTGATNRELTAKVTGEGNLTLTTDATGISLNNSANSYTGDTTVTAGKVTAGSNNAFGQTASLIINASAEVNLNGKTQTAGSLANSGTLDLANGQLTLTNGGSSTATGGLTGAGSLTINGGELTVSAANAGLTAATTIATNGAVTLTGAGTLGSSAIAVAGDLNLNGANSQFANVLSGAGNVNTNAAITLTGNNSGFTGTQVIGANGELTVGSANSLGGENASVDLINSGASLVFNAVNQAITQAISGVAGSTVNVSNGATMSLTADNSAFAGSYALSGNSSLSVSKGNNLGTSAVAIASGSNLIYNALNDGSSTALANSLSGDGSVTLSGSQMTLLAGNSNAADFTGLFDITNGSSLTLSDDAQLNDGATVNVAQTGDSLNIASSADYTMNYALTGNGLVNVDATNNGFNFSSNAGSAFAGTVNLANATFTLAGDNTSALTNATLSLSGGSKTTVSAGEQDIGNLTLNGGTLVFNGDGVVNTNTLATAGNSIIQINQNNIPVSDTGSAINLLDQSKGQESQLVNAQDSSGLDVNKLTLQDLEGNALSDGSEHDLVQNSDTVAKAVYDYQLVNNEGLSVAYVLQQLNLLTDKTLTLDSTGATNRELTAKVTGEGNLTLTTDATGISLNNSANSYTGDTTVTAGKVTAGSNNAFGQTASLIINASAEVNLNGKTQTAGSLANSGTLDLANGQLTLTNGGSSTATGGLTGAGSLTINGGELTVSAANAGLTAATTIATNGAVTLTGAGTLGSSAIAVAGDLNLNGANSQFANVLSGAGNVNTNAAITLTGNNSGFTGTQVIGANGELTVGSANSLGGENASVNLINSGASLVFNAVNQAITQAISGVAGSTVNVSNGATMSLTADNSAFAGSYALSGNSSLSVSKGNNLGTSAVAIASGSNLIYNALNDGSSTALANSLSGDGSVTLSDSQMTLLAGNSNAADFTGLFDITNGSSLTLSDDAQLNDGATVNVAQTGDSLNIASSADYTMNYALTGNGLVNVDATNNGFNFSSNTGSAFAGTVNLANATFTLAGDNTSALTNATLSLSGGSKTTVSAGEQDIGNLTLNGGTLVFNGDGVVNTNTLATAGNSIIQINQNNIPVSDTGSAINLLDQSKGQESQLVNAQDSSGLDVNKLTLQDLEGNALSDGSEHDLVQNSDTVAKAVYDYQLVNNEGLSVAYVLQQLNLLTDKTLTLDSTGATNRELTAKVTGEGNLTLTTDATGISLNNSANSYTGDTTVTAGKVTAGSNNAFGQTASLIINASAEVNLNGKTQTAGSLANSGTLDLANGQLTLTNGGSSTATGGLTGAGSLTINGGELTVSAANAGLTAATTIATNGAVTLTGAGTLGSSAIAVAGDLNLNGANSQFANVLSGAGNVNTNAAITLTGNNSGFTGTQVIGANGELTVGSANSLGGENASVDLINSGASLVFNAVNQAITQAISGVAGSTVNVSNGATMSLTADNSAFAGSYALSGNSSLSVSKGNNLGTSAVAIASGSNLIYNALNDGSSTALANSLSGDGSVTLSGSQMTLLAGNSNAADFTGLFDITNGSSLTLSDDAQLNDGATVNVAQTGDSLNIASSADYTMNYALTGNGLVNVDATNNGFNFSSNAGSAFAGTVNLANATFTLAGNNTSALTNATLTLAEGSNVTVADGEQAIHGLTMNGGTLVFNNITENNGQFTSEGTISVDTLDVSGTGDIHVALPVDIHPDISGNTVTQLDEGDVILQLAQANNVIGYAGNLNLNDTNGDPLPQDVEENLINSGNTEKSATGYFNYKLTTGYNEDGLYLSYGLVKVDLLGTGDNALIVESTAAQNGKGSSSLTAQVIGSGDLAIVGNSADTVITVANSDNSYTGKTDVRSGILQLGSDNALGNTAELIISDVAQTNLNGMTQTIGALSNSGVFDFAGGKLTVTNGGSSSASGGLTGTGQLIVTGGDLAVSGENNTFTASTEIANGASVSLNDIGTLGTSAITLEGALNLNGDNGNFKNVLSGSGDVNVNANIGLVVDNLDFAGAFNIANGGLLAVTDVNQLGTAAINNEGNMLFDLNNRDQTLSNVIAGAGNLVKNGISSLTIGTDQTYTGNTNISQGNLFINENVTLGGVGAGDVIVSADGILSGAGTVNGRVINYGTINVAASLSSLSRALPGATQFTINNDLDNYGQINIGNANNTIVGNSLVVNGNYTGYNNAIIYMNTALSDDANSQLDQLVISGHAGGSTLIHINDVGGTGASTSQKGVKLIDNGSSDIDAFTLDNTVVKGAYEYVLQRDNTDQDWYLTSYQESLYRPDFGIYIANADSVTKSLLPSFGSKPSGALAAGAGGLRAMDRLNREDDSLSSVWMINSAGHSKGQAAGGQIKYDYNDLSSVVGVDTRVNANGSAFIIGAMTGYTNVSSSSRNSYTGSDSSGSVNGNTFGLYGSWYFNEDDVLSPFVDAYVSYGHYRNSVKTWGNEKDAYSSNVWSYTLQGGYPILASDNLVVEPQAQVSYLSYSAGNTTDHAGTDISQSLKGHAIYRIGAYVYPYEGDIKPYAGINVWYDTTRSEVKFDGTALSSDKGGFTVEGKMGVQAKLKNNFTLSGELNTRSGQHSSQNYSANIGIKYQF